MFFLLREFFIPVEAVKQLSYDKYHTNLFQPDQFVLSTNLFFKTNVSLPLVTGELLQKTIDVTSVTYELYNIKI